MIARTSNAIVYGAQVVCVRVCLPFCACVCFSTAAPDDVDGHGHGAEGDEGQRHDEQVEDVCVCT